MPTSARSVWIAEIELGPRWRAGASDEGRTGIDAEVDEDLVDGVGFRDPRDDGRLAGARWVGTDGDVDREHAGPRSLAQVMRFRLVHGGLGFVRVVLDSRGLLGLAGRWTGYQSGDGAAELASGSKRPMEPRQVNSWWRDQRRQATQKRDRIQGHMGLAGQPGPAQPIADVARWRDRKPRLGRMRGEPRSGSCARGRLDRRAPQVCRRKGRRLRRSHGHHAEPMAATPNLPATPVARLPRRCRWRPHRVRRRRPGRALSSRPSSRPPRSRRIRARCSVAALLSPTAAPVIEREVAHDDGDHVLARHVVAPGQTVAQVPDIPRGTYKVCAVDRDGEPTCKRVKLRRAGKTARVNLRRAAK